MIQRTRASVPTTSRFCTLGCWELEIYRGGDIHSTEMGSAAKGGLFFLDSWVSNIYQHWKRLGLQKKIWALISA